MTTRIRIRVNDPEPEPACYGENRAESKLRLSLSPLLPSQTSRFNTCTRSQTLILPRESRDAFVTNPFLSFSACFSLSLFYTLSLSRSLVLSSAPVTENRQKLPFASMLLLCQHSHYVSANSKPLLYLFSRL